MTAGKQLNWCARCHHAITPDGRGSWVHFSDDDWSGSSCPCANQLSPCAPARRSPAGSLLV